MTIKTFRGLLADGGQDQIYLAGGDASTGYRIVKFQVMPNNPAGQDPEAIMQIFKTKPASAPGTIDFRSDDVLAAAYYSGGSSVSYTQDSVIIFDKEVINQDIYITCYDDSDNESMNYYIELEEVKMSNAEAANVNFIAALIHT